MGEGWPFAGGEAGEAEAVGIIETIGGVSEMRGTNVEHESEGEVD